MEKKIWSVNGSVNALAAINSLSLSPDNFVLAAGCGDNTIKLWNVATGEQTDTLKGHLRSVNKVAFSRDALWLVSASDDPSIIFWRVYTEPGIGFFKFHFPVNFSISDIAVSPTFKVAVASELSRTISLIDITKKVPARHCCYHDSGIQALTYSPNGRLLVTASDDIATVWSVNSGARLKVLEGLGYIITSIAFSVDGKVLALGDSGGRVTLWCISSGNLIQKIDAHPNTVNELAFSPSGQFLASCSGTVGGNSYPTLQVCDLYQKESLVVKDSGNVTSLLFLDNNRLAVGCQSGTLSVYNIGSLDIWG